jgi:hypothetical protein
MRAAMSRAARPRENTRKANHAAAVKAVQDVTEGLERIVQESAGLGPVHRDAKVIENAVKLLGIVIRDGMLFRRYPDCQRTSRPEMDMLLSAIRHTRPSTMGGGIARSFVLDVVADRSPPALCFVKHSLEKLDEELVRPEAWLPPGTSISELPEEGWSPELLEIFTRGCEVAPATLPPRELPDNVVQFPLRRPAAPLAHQP